MENGGNLLQISIADLRVTRKIWSDEQCRPVLASLVESASNCWDICKETTECTAVNYNLEHGNCVLRHCENPVPAPEGSFSPYIGISALPPGKNSSYFQNEEVSIVSVFLAILQFMKSVIQRVPKYVLNKRIDLSQM